MTGELRAQRREPCIHGETNDGFPCYYGNPSGRPCEGCNRDHTRWVNIGDLIDRGDTIVPGLIGGYVPERRYAIGINR